MRKQVNITLLQLLILPSISFAACPANISQVNVTYGHVQWEGSYNTSCLDGFKVCWSSETNVTLTLFCEIVPASATNLTVYGVQPCDYVVVKVTAIGEGLNDSVSATGSGQAGLPKVSHLRVQTINHTSLQLKWESVEDYECIDRINLWVCDTITADLSTCVFQEMSPKFNMIELQGYDFPVCQDLYAFMSTADDFETSPLNSRYMYIPSNNRLDYLKVINVTADSAVLEYKLNIVDQNCTTDIFEKCILWRNYIGDVTSICAALQPDRVGSTDLIHYNSLNACISYSVSVKLGTSDTAHFEEEVVFITSRGDQPVIVNASATWSYGDVVVDWTTTREYLPCLRLFNVSWNSSEENVTSWRPVDPDLRAAVISMFYNKPKTFFAEVTAVFTDGTEESHSAEVNLNELNEVSSISSVTEVIVGSSSHLRASIVSTLSAVISLAIFIDII